MANLKGPLFDDPAQVIDQAVEEINQTVGRQAKAELVQRFGHVLQHPTGRYVSRLRVAEEAGRVVVDDQRTVYGPWLEGTGSRNGRTRFKGYATFRRTFQQIDRDAKRIADQVIARHIGRLK